MNRSPYIEESMVYGIDDDELEGTVVSVQVRPDYEAILARFGPEYDDDKIYALMKREIRSVNEGLPNYKRIHNVSVRREEFIKTTTKKIKRHKNI